MRHPHHSFTATLSLVNWHGFEAGHFRGLGTGGRNTTKPFLNHESNSSYANAFHTTMFVDMRVTENLANLGVPGEIGNHSNSSSSLSLLNQVNAQFECLHENSHTSVLYIS